MDLLVILGHYIYIKNFGRFILNKTKNKNKKYFCKSCLQCFISKNVLSEHKSSIDSSINNNGISYTRKYQDHVPCSFAYKVGLVNKKYGKKIVLYRGRNAVNVFIKSILNEYNCFRKIIRKYFNKNLIMSAEENRLMDFNRLIENTDNKLRDHCHINDKYRGAAHYC